MKRVDERLIQPKTNRVQRAHIPIKHNVTLRTWNDAIVAGISTDVPGRSAPIPMFLQHRCDWYSDFTNTFIPRSIR